MDISAQDPRIWSHSTDRIVFFNTERARFNTIQVASVVQSSDVKYKKNIETINSSLETIRQLRGTSFLWTYQDELKSAGLGNYGFIAQEVEQVIPEIVSTDSLGYKGVDYSAIIPIAVEAIKELSQMVEEQAKEIEVLKAQNNGIATRVSSAEIDDDKAILFSNIPNPFGDKTEISCYLPNSSKSAFLIIYDLNGNQVNRMTVKGTGNVKVTVPASDLKSGMYLYSLIVDGKEIDTKRMIVL
ncbi:tail fiber domain-containing protein [Alkalitalea saponilacus]|uniref:Por secretion system C-terminal sorting domain-containing protein n=1 Tax=Alkalitalea saponilacus TaxID=889453 RepID=A0A1T5HTF4_9BACT|nr:tail fiber domain-containing protein [Alkalitalea saponilacus]SKC23892.1 Por secretion system C-terminal sorting domain-containing protein [Alkalitalea saponilacus]